MTWQEKMTFIIREVLGEGYRIEVIDNRNFKTYNGDSLICETETLLEIPSHWQSHVTNIINMVNETKILVAFQKLNNDRN